MNILLEALPEFLGGLGTAAVIVAVTRVVRRRNVGVRRYTLLSTVGADGNPLHHFSTLPTGTVISRDTGGQRERFQLTGAVLADGTYAAEPVDRYV
ncbi:hypothetical protein ACFCXA_28480 [Streptomyces virginiae]|uniref:hypothetical protein n=1 Tax=Streptomyces virginiae TaxID=1961 RepID=UPI0035DCC35A